MTFQNWIRNGLVASVVVAGALLASIPSGAAQESECRGAEGSDLEICDAFLSHWEKHGGEATFGQPITPQFTTIDPETFEEREVQYFERTVLEHHPELTETPYAVQSGRLGAELLAAEGINWWEYPDASPDDPFYMEQTGQAIAPEFQEYWSGHGLDLGDEGVSFRESVALFGFPLSPAEEDVNAAGESVLVQWFERARLEMNEAGEVGAAPLGTLIDDDSDGLSIRVKREIDATLESIFESHDSPGLSVWLQSPQLGDSEWVHGVADFEANEPYERDTHQRVGSVTKTFTSTVVLQLVEEGLLDLDDTVDQWFPELDGGDAVTVRMLGTMTSGVGNYTESPEWQEAAKADPYRVWEPEELLEYAFEMTGTVEPDGTWAYSNTNYIMLGLIIEDVTGNDVRDELSARILEPLGLESTSLPGPEETTLPEPYARGIPGGLMAEVGDDSTDWNTSGAWTAGQMVSTASDMLTWLPAFYEGALLNEEIRAEQFDVAPVSPDFPELGYGFGVSSAMGWYGHDGGIPGYLSFTFYRPDLEASLVVLSNSNKPSEEMTTAGSAGFAAIQQILEREYPSPAE